MYLQDFEGVEDVNSVLLEFSSHTCCGMQIEGSIGSCFVFPAAVNALLLCWSEVYHICNGSSLQQLWFLILV